MPPRRPHDQLTQNDVRQILAAATSSDEDHLFLLLLAKTGRRIGELLNITARDIDFHDKCIWTDIEKRRTKQRRKMFVDDETLAELRRYISRHSLSNSEKLFQRCKRMYQRLPMRYAEKAGIDKYFSVHGFRAYFITSLIKRGWSYDAIQKLTGHISIASLRAYDHAEIEVVEDRFRAIVNEL